MKKIVCILLVMVLLFVPACSKKTTEETKDVGNDMKRIKVYTSIYPMYDFTKQIGKDRIDLELMVPPGAEPHDWEPTAKLMGEMEKANVFIYNGVQMEMWADKVIGALSNNDLIVVEASEGVDLLKFEEHNHDEEDIQHNEQKHEHKHGAYDPHVWLDPIRAIKQAQNIKNALVKADEENKEFYEANFNEFKDKLRALDSKYKDELSDRELDEIVVAHAAFGYLADRYGFKQIAISGLTPQEEPSAAKLAQITEVVNAHGIKYIFYETLANPKLSEVLAKETGANTEVLNPMGGLTKEDRASGKDYTSIMEENLLALKKALYK